VAGDWPHKMPRSTRLIGSPIRRGTAPLGRVVLLNDLDCEIERADGSVVSLREAGRFTGFELSMGLPSWHWEIDDLTLEHSVLMPARHNLVHITFRLIGAEHGVRLRLRPFISFRQLEPRWTDRWPIPTG
jgi:hypothetical protein